MVFRRWRKNTAKPCERVKNVSVGADAPHRPLTQMCRIRRKKERNPAFYCRRYGHRPLHKRETPVLCQTKLGFLTYIGENEENNAGNIAGMVILQFGARAIKKIFLPFCLFKISAINNEGFIWRQGIAFFLPYKSAACFSCCYRKLFLI